MNKLQQLLKDIEDQIIQLMFNQGHDDMTGYYINDLYLMKEKLEKLNHKLKNHN